MNKDKRTNIHKCQVPSDVDILPSSSSSANVIEVAPSPSTSLQKILETDPTYHLYYGQQHPFVDFPIVVIPRESRGHLHRIRARSATPRSASSRLPKTFNTTSQSSRSARSIYTSTRAKSESPKRLNKSDSRLYENSGNCHKSSIEESSLFFNSTEGSVRYNVKKEEAEEEIGSINTEPKAKEQDILKRQILEVIDLENQEDAGCPRPNYKTNCTNLCRYWCCCCCK